MKKKFSDNLEKFLIMNITFTMIVYMAVNIITQYFSVHVYYLIMMLSIRRIIYNINTLSYYWDHPEDCPQVDWCEKLTMRIFKNGKIRKS